MTAGADLRSDRPGVVLTAGPAPQDWSASADAFGALDEQGCPAIWLTDHLFWGRPMPEALTMAALAASATRRCTVGTGVLQLPLRSTAAVAKAAATVQVLSGGRFVLGVGIGEHEHEYDEVLIWTGSDPENPHDLGGELLIDIEGETYSVTTSGALYIPAGLRHCPLDFKKVTRPIRFSALSLSGDGNYHSDEDVPKD